MSNLSFDKLNEEYEKIYPSSIGSDQVKKLSAQSIRDAIKLVAPDESLQLTLLSLAKLISDCFIFLLKDVVKLKEIPRPPVAKMMMDTHEVDIDTQHIIIKIITDKDFIKINRTLPFYMTEIISTNEMDLLRLKFKKPISELLGLLIFARKNLKRPEIELTSEKNSITKIAPEEKPKTKNIKKPISESLGQLISK